MDELENALAWFGPAPKRWLASAKQDMEALGQWIWEVIQGDFNQDQTTGQLVTGTIISMIPFVDQICDVRDVVANAKAIKEDEKNTMAWVALCLTLVGLIPVLGSLAKGACKVMFSYMRKSGFDIASKAIKSKPYDAAIKGLNQLLELPATKKTLKFLKIYNPYKYFAEQVRLVKGKISSSALLKQLDELLNACRTLLNKAADWGPASIKRPINQTLELLGWMRERADKMVPKALGPLNETLERLARRLEIEADNAHRGFVKQTNVRKIDRLTNVGEADLIRKHKPKWAIITKRAPYPALEGLPPSARKKISEGWPDISTESPKGYLKRKFDTFDETMAAAEIPPGEKIYRVLDPNSSDNSICWMREAEFKALSSKADWRERFAVWKHWNGNGEYVTYTIPPGNPLRVWEGRTGTQVLDKAEDIKLKGGAVQIVLDPAELQKEYLGKRQPTGWGYTDIDIPGDADVFIGIPQLTHNWRE